MAMKSQFPNQALLLALTLALGAGTTAFADGEKQAEKKGSTNEVAAIPQSVFIIPASPKEGRNPFFPKSVSEAQVRKVKPEEVDSSSIVLNGITSPPKRTAMINGKTFETGESGEVRLHNGGRLSIQCLEIRSDTAVILVGTQRKELRLRTGI